MANISTVQGLAELIKGDFSYASKYEVEITFPGSLNFRQGIREMTLRCDTISIPGRNLRTVGDFNVYGPPIEVVQGQTFGEISTSFYASSDMRERRIMEDWQDAVVDPNTFDLNYYDEYVGSLKVFLLDKKETKVYGIELREVYPKSIDVIALGHASSNTINKVGVSFQYRYWKRLDIGSTVGL